MLRMITKRLDHTQVQTTQRYTHLLELFFRNFYHG